MAAPTATGEGPDSTRHSPLHDRHVSLGATFTDFGGWQMPLKYGRELAEHAAVREQAGLFDLSHMGELRVHGPQAAEFLDFALISKLSAISVGRAKYSMLVEATGGIIDDLITYRLGEEEFLVVPNAANTTAVYDALVERSNGFDVRIDNETLGTALVAIQGPRAEEIVLRLVGAADDADSVRDLRYYSAVTLCLAGVSEVLLARTGYTGEDGFELIAPAADAAAIWDAAREAGDDLGLTCCGLAARDSLRLEAAMPFYGHELSRALTPVAARLKVLVSKKKKGEFFGRALLSAPEPGRVLAGFSSTGRRAARAGATITSPEGTEIGEVTSGQPSPTLGRPIALGYIDRQYAEPGTEVQMIIRGRAYPFEVVETPFYRRATTA